MLLAALRKAVAPGRQFHFHAIRRLTSQLTIKHTARNADFSALPTRSRILSQCSHTRFFSSANPGTGTGAAATFPSPPSPSPPALPVLTPKSVGVWLMVSSTLVFAIVVVGGVTRLTESGLSITEWRPITGILPPLTHDEWTAEFEKYKATPEFKLLNSNFTLDDFKFIFSMEWAHRVLGRVLGVAFVGPLIYFAARRKLSRPVFLQLSSLGLLIGAQGLLGWYMVQSGLEDAILETPGAVPRVSQYRLAAHLGLALALYAGMFGAGMATIKDWKYAKGFPFSGLTTASGGNVQAVLRNPAVRAFKRNTWALTGLVFLTALSGAFVAGLDAGLLYNEFPLMGGRLAPPTDELFSPDYAKSADKSDLWWRNIFENPTTVQFNHRVLATTTYFATAALFAQSLRPTLKAALPPVTHLATKLAFGMANIQVLLGISTLLYLVPVPLAAAHQAGSVMLLTAMMHVLVTLRRPGVAARVWRKVNTAAAKAGRRKEREGRLEK